MTMPQVEYGSSTDGVRIAFVRNGAGPPLVIAPGMGSTIEFGTGQPENAAGEALFNAGLEQTYTVIRYDMRGYGLSDRDSFPTTVDRLVADLSAVADAAGLEQFVLIGRSQGGQAAIQYSADHPDRVSQLVLLGAFAEFNERERAMASTMADLWEVNWGVASKTLSEMFFLDTEQATREFAERQRQIAERGAIVALLKLNAVSSVTEALERIQTPTLVIHSRDDQVVPFHHGRQLASAIKGARLVTVSGDHMVTVGAHREEIVEAIAEFTGASGAPPDGPAPGGFQTILFTDLEGSTALTQRLGDEGAQEVLHGHNTAVRGALEANGGREVKHTGDGIMATFPSAVSAVQAAIAIQREMAGAEVRVRIGLNAGEPIAEDDDLFGLSVIKAARIGDRAEPGQVLVSRVVMELCEGKTFEFISMGDATLKGLDEPVALYEVRV